MPVKRITSITDFRKFVDARIEAIQKAIIRNLAYLGEQCVNKARIDGNYTDRTGNLRGSIGFVVVANGRIVQLAGFSTSYGEGQSGGVKKGEALARRLAAGYTSGYALIVVAGMNYSACVEAMENKIVLTSAETYAKRRLPAIMRTLSKQITA